MEIQDDTHKQTSSSRDEYAKTKRKPEDYYLVELLLMKEVVQGLYGKGTFNSSIEKEILIAIGFKVLRLERSACSK